MNIRSIITRFKYGQLWQLFWLSIKYPLYIYPTLKATSKSFIKAKKEFPDTHGKNGKANAYRHALWNSLICFECKKWTKNTRRVLVWSKLITDKHEQLSPNKPLEERMDLHNNKIGRNLFTVSSFTSVEEISETIKLRMERAEKIKTLKDIERYPTQLVYINEL